MKHPFRDVMIYLLILLVGAFLYGHFFKGDSASETENDPEYSEIEFLESALKDSENTVQYYSDMIDSTESYAKIIDEYMEENESVPSDVRDAWDSLYSTLAEHY